MSETRVTRTRTRRAARESGRVIWDDLTLEQFLRLPEAKPALEYVDGKVIQKVAAKRAHSVMQSVMGAYLWNHAVARGLGMPYTELRCTFDDWSIVPDVCFIRRGRVPKDEHGAKVEDIAFPPDLAIEVISPGQTVKNLSARLNWCVQHGVRLAWLIQPRKRIFHVFKPGQPVAILASGQLLEGEDVVPEFRITIDDLFHWLDMD